MQTVSLLVLEHVKNKRLIVTDFVVLGLYHDVQSICLSVTWRAEDKKQQILDGKVRAPSDE